MLSRAAASLWVLGRQLERADHLARLLDVHSALALDRPDEPGTGFWTGLIALAGWVGSDVERRDQAVELVVAGSAGPSVRRCIGDARSAAQAVRPTLPREVYEQLNALFWRLQGANWESDLHGCLVDVEMGVHLVGGLLEDTMPHDEALDFVRLGKYLERARNVAAVVANRSQETGSAADTELGWGAVLKSCCSYESYLMRSSAPMTAEAVSAFLLLDPGLPRSVRFSVGQARAAVRRIDGARTGSRPAKLLRRLAAMFDDATAAAVGREPDGFRGILRKRLSELDAALRETYFRPSRVSSAVPGGGPGRVPQQQ